MHLTIKDDILTLKVTDNGIGISDIDKEVSKSYGLMGISERLFRWNGKFELKSKKKGGTEATVTLPLINGNDK